MDGKEYENIYNFVNGDYKVYPPEFSENDKRSLCQKGKKNYRIKQNGLYYIYILHPPNQISIIVHNLFKTLNQS
jgi:hypothetical protein